jgi:LytS/YehU family sensor histidine kinase
VELESMRYNNRLDLKYNIEGDVDHHRIAPLILLPFIENAFKHGASKDRKNPKVEINIKIDEKCLALQVKNSIHPEKEKEEKLNEGIGLKNVRRRLELLYPKSHKLTIDKQDMKFEINLKVCWGNE